MPNATVSSLSKPDQTRLKRACTRIERAVFALATLAEGVDSEVLAWHAETVGVGRTGNRQATFMLEQHEFGLEPMDAQGSAHAQLAYKLFCKRYKTLIDQLGRALAALTELVLEVGCGPVARWVHPVVDVWGEGRSVRVWLRKSHFEGCEAIRAQANNPAHSRPLPPGGLLPAVLLACKARGVGMGPTWDVGPVSACFPVEPGDSSSAMSASFPIQAADFPSAIAWYTAVYNHNALYLFDGTSTVLG